MYDVNELSKRIDAVNARITALNGERNRNLGKREELDRQYKSLIEEYQKTYGVSLTPDSIMAEVEAVTSAKEAEVTKVEQALAFIADGKMADAEMLLTGRVASAEENKEVGINGEIITPEQNEQPKVLDTPVATETVVSAEREVVGAAPATVTAPETVPTPAPVAEVATPSNMAETLEMPQGETVVTNNISSTALEGLGLPPIPGMPSMEKHASYAEQVVADIPPAPPVFTPEQSKVAEAPKSVEQPANRGIGIPAAPPTFGSGDSPFSAMAGFTKPAQQAPIVDPAQQEATPSKPTGKPVSFGAIFGGSAFKP